MHFIDNMPRPESFLADGDNVTWLHGDGKSLTQTSKDTGFVRWVLTMLGRLVDADEYLIGHTSGLRTFVRLDVGVYRNASTGDFQYFINEMSKGINVGLFMEWADPLDRKIFFTELAHTLHFVAAQSLLLRHQEQHETDEDED